MWVDRKTARRYITAAVELGVDRSGGEEQLTGELTGQVCERVRPAVVHHTVATFRAGKSQHLSQQLGPTNCEAVSLRFSSF